MIIALFIVIGILVTVFIKPIMAYLTYRFVKKEVKESPKLYKRSFIIVLLPLLLLMLIGVLGSSAEGGIVFLVVLAPFLLPALVSAFIVGFFIKRLIRDKKDPSAQRSSRVYTSSQNTSYDEPNVVDTTYQEIPRDLNGDIKDMIWRANNPQPKNYPAIRR